MPSYSKNKKAYHDYIVLETLEAGIQLNGDEVKSIKDGSSNLKGGFVDVEKEQAFLNEIHISPYSHSSRQIHDPSRKRKLLLHKKEILKLEKAIYQSGITAIPLELYSKKGLIKLKLGICKGKQLHDKREALKRKSQERDIRREIKNY